jgi:hypothetical protein
MAVQGPIPLDFARAFPRGAFASGAFEPVRDFDASKDGRFVQSRDKVTGLPLWQADVIDGDPEARDKTVRVKVAAPDQPVLPAPGAGFPFVNQAGRLAYSLKATAVRVPGRSGRGSGSGQEAAA